MNDIETAKTGDKTPLNRNPLKIAEWKMEKYRNAWRTLTANNEENGLTVPCPGDCCDSVVFAKTLAEIDRIRKGEDLCSECLEHGASYRLRKFYEIAPRAFFFGEQATVPERLARLKSVADVWGNGHLPEHSLFIFGDTGKQKSRTMWHLIRERVLPGLATYRVLGGGELREMLLAAGLNVSAVKMRLATVDFLAFDDFAQDCLTETMFADLWSILDKRFRNGFKTVFLSNVLPNELSRKYADDYSMRSMIRRIQDFCKIIKF